MKFTFPDIFPSKKHEERKESEMKSIEESKQGFKRFLERNKGRPGTPGWFSI